MSVNCFSKVFHGQILSYCKRSFVDHLTCTLRHNMHPKNITAFIIANYLGESDQLIFRLRPAKRADIKTFSLE